VNLIEDLAPAVDPADIDSHALHQALSNLISNAIDATAEADGALVRVSTAVPDDQTLEIRVRDNGPGVPEEVVRDLFTGMITTKGSKGTGLGLLVVHKIVGELGGTVEMCSNTPEGACFRIQLPRFAAGQPLDAAP
jgi:C4-dicarboxylate-specific signal transduction histidine kinase